MLAVAWWQLALHCQQQKAWVEEVAFSVQKMKVEVGLTGVLNEMEWRVEDAWMKREKMILLNVQEGMVLVADFQNLTHLKISVDLA